MTDPVTPTPITQRSGWKAVLWALGAALVDVALLALDVVTLPAWVHPFVPVAAGFLRFLAGHLRGPMSYRVSTGLRAK